MNCVIQRKPSALNGTFGEWFINDKFFCHTLERPADGDHPCIPAGTYECNRFHSPRNGLCWLLDNVPGRSMIEVHSSNVYTQLLGCIAPGMTLGVFGGLPAVLQSKLAMQKLYGMLGDTFMLTIRDAV